jgi:hypothetical protein
MIHPHLTAFRSYCHWPPRYDVAHLDKGPLRVTASPRDIENYVEAHINFTSIELDYRTLHYVGACMGNPTRSTDLSHRYF